MPITRLQTRQEAAKRAALAVSQENTANSKLPQDMLNLVIDTLAQQERHRLWTWDHPLGALRLVSNQFLAAVDLNVKCMRVECRYFLCSWPHHLVGLQHVAHLYLRSVGPGNWRDLTKLVQQLPSLSSIAFCDRFDDWSRYPAIPPAFSATLTGLTRLEMPCLDAGTLPGSIQLPFVAAATFGRAELHKLAAVVPAVQQLWCWQLNTSHWQTAILPSCTHYGGDSVVTDPLTDAWRRLWDPTDDETTQAETEAAKQFAKALPQLKVLYETPEFHCRMTGRLPTCVVLQYCTKLTDVRVYQTFEPGPTCGLGKLSALTGLTRLSIQECVKVDSDSDDEYIYGRSRSKYTEHKPWTGSDGISALTQLKRLRLTSNQFPSKDQPDYLGALSDMAKLPRLECAAVPATLLCPQCLSKAGVAEADVRPKLLQLAAQPGLKRLVFMYSVPTVWCKHLEEDEETCNIKFDKVSGAIEQFKAEANTARSLHQRHLMEQLSEDLPQQQEPQAPGQQSAEAGLEVELLDYLEHADYRVPGHDCMCSDNRDRIDYPIWGMFGMKGDW